MGRDKGLRLGRDWREHALLVEADAVAAASILRAFKSRAADLLVPESKGSVVTEYNTGLP